MGMRGWVGGWGRGRECGRLFEYLHLLCCGPVGDRWQILDGVSHSDGSQRCRCPPVSRGGVLHATWHADVELRAGEHVARRGPIREDLSGGGGPNEGPLSGLGDAVGAGLKNAEPDLDRDSASSYVKAFFSI